MQKQLFVLFSVIFSICYVAGQVTQIETIPKIKHNSIYVELGGNSLAYSLNYDYTFSLAENTKLAVGAGLGYYTMHSYANGPTPTETNLFFFTPEANLLFGKKSHHLEMGASLLLFAFPALRIGYRYQRPQGGFLFRVGFTPFVPNLDFVPWGGISFGYTF